MKIFYGFIKLEWKNFFTKRNMIVIGIIACMAIFYGQLNIISYNQLDHGAGHGTAPIGKIHRNYMMVPPTAAILFYNSGVFAPMHGIAAGDSVHICSDNGDKQLFSRQWNSDLSELFLILGSLLLMFYGAAAFKHRNFYRMCNSHLSLMKIYLYTIFSRYIVASFFLAVFLIDAVTQILLNGINLTQLDYLQIVRFSLLWLSCSFFFLCLGALIGMLRDRGNVRLVVVGIWFFQLFFFPILVNIFASLEQSSINNLKELAGNHDRKMIRSIDEWERYALLTPAGTYMMMTQEMSNLGYMDRLNFHRFIVNHSTKLTGGIEATTVYRSVSLMPAHYLRGLLILTLYNLLTLAGGYFSMRRVFYKPCRNPLQPIPRHTTELISGKTINPNTGQTIDPDAGETVDPVSGLTIEPLSGKAINPETGLLIDPASGMTINPDTDQMVDPFELEIEPGDSDVYAIRHPAVVDQIWSRQFNPNPSKRINSGPGHRVFICAPEDLPGDVKVETLLQFMCTIAGVKDITEQEELCHIHRKSFAEIDSSDKLCVLMEIAKLKVCNFYLFYNTVAWMTPDEILAFRNFVKSLQEESRATIIYLTTDPEIRAENETGLVVRIRKFHSVVDMLERMT